MSPAQNGKCRNHCPACFYSKHVDIEPGDRAANCAGLMKPLQIEQAGKTFFILHECEKCHFQRKNKTAPDDEVGETFLNLLGSTITKRLSVDRRKVRIMR